MIWTGPSVPKTVAQATKYGNFVRKGIMKYGADNNVDRADIVTLTK
jgi:hypothetical protein